MVDALGSSSPALGDHVTTSRPTPVEVQTEETTTTTTTTMVPNPLPIALYQTLLSKLVAVLQLTHQPEGTTTPAAKLALLQAVGRDN
jgi:hypothetical protein